MKRASPSKDLGQPHHYRVASIQNIRFSYAFTSGVLVDRMGRIIFTIVALGTIEDLIGGQVHETAPIDQPLHQSPGPQDVYPFSLLGLSLAFIRMRKRSAMDDGPVGLTFKQRFY